MDICAASIVAETTNSSACKDEKHRPGSPCSGGKVVNVPLEVVRELVDGDKNSDDALGLGPQITAVRIKPRLHAGRPVIRVPLQKVEGRSQQLPGLQLDATIKASRGTPVMDNAENKIDPLSELGLLPQLATNVTPQALAEMANKGSGTAHGRKMYGTSKASVEETFGHSALSKVTTLVLDSWADAVKLYPVPICGLFFIFLVACTRKPSPKPAPSRGYRRNSMDKSHACETVL